MKPQYFNKLSDAQKCAQETGGSIFGNEAANEYSPIRFAVADWPGDDLDGDWTVTE